MIPLLNGAVTFSPGYSPLWRGVLGGQEVQATPLPELAGPHGDCWVNARTVVLGDPDRFSYVEGLVASPKPRIGRGWTITAGLIYPHAWVRDEAGDHEVTVGWTALTDVAVYIPGTVFNAAAVEEVLARAERRPWFHDAPPEAKAVSLLELLEVL